MAHDVQTMPLSWALFLLARVHTRPDELTGYVTVPGAQPEPSQREDYYTAWGAVLNYLQGATSRKHVETVQ